MKRILFSGAALLLTMMAAAQMKQGSVSYDRTAQMRMRINTGQGDEEKQETRTDKFELSYANNKSLWKAAEKENEDEGGADGGGMQIKMIVAGSDDVLFNDFTAGKSTELRVFFDKKFIVDDSIHSLKWKMGEETKNILGHNCRNATTTTINTRMMMNVNNGVMERKPIQDTSMITAWYADDIPVSAGPAEYQGQLPGLILALDINNGKTVYRATGITEKTDIAAIKEPTGKKHYTPAEFRAEREKMMDEMQKNNQGGGRQIRLN